MIEYSIKLLNELGACHVYQNGQLIPDVSVSLGCQTDPVHINPPQKDVNVVKQRLESESGALGHMFSCPDVVDDVKATPVDLFDDGEPFPLFVALRDIDINEEILFDYGDNNIRNMPCQCNICQTREPPAKKRKRKT